MADEDDQDTCTDTAHLEIIEVTEGKLYYVTEPLIAVKSNSSR